MRQAIDGKEEELDFTLYKRRSRRVLAKALADLHFAGYIVLLSEQIEQTNSLLHEVERECKKVEFKLNMKKRKAMSCNLKPSPA